MAMIPSTVPVMLVSTVTVGFVEGHPNIVAAGLLHLMTGATVVPKCR